MNMPGELKYTKDHEWVKLEGGTATIGITDYAQEHLTDIVFVELPEIGRKAEEGKPIAAVESVKAVSDVFAPIDGEVTEVNEKLQDAPETLNTDPYVEGWIFKVKPANASDVDKLLSADDYKKLIAE